MGGRKRCGHSVRTKFAQCLIALSLIVTIGGHWAVLQSVAWVGMAISFSKDAPLADALVKTFDGQHPCHLCKVVKTGRQTERKQALIKVETKLDLMLDRTPGFISASVHLDWLLPDFSASASARTHSPPVPPPRAA